MTKANDIQPGGTHYVSKYQHWDWTTDNRLGYLESAASKYIARWKKKNGMEDLDKAHHYVSKAIEVAEEGRYMNDNSVWKSIRFANTMKFIMAADLDYHQGALMHMLSDWDEPADLKVVLNILHEYMRPYKEALEAAAAGAVPTPAQHGGKGTPAQPVAGLAPGKVAPQPAKRTKLEDMAFSACADCLGWGYVMEKGGGAIDICSCTGLELTRKTYGQGIGMTNPFGYDDDGDLGGHPGSDPE